MKTLWRAFIYTSGTLLGALFIIMILQGTVGREGTNRYGGLVLTMIPLVLAWGIAGKHVRMIWHHFRLDHAKAAKIAESVPRPLFPSSRVALAYNKAIFYMSAGDLARASELANSLRNEKIPANLQPHVHYLDSFCTYFSGGDLNAAGNASRLATKPLNAISYPHLLLALIRLEQGDESEARCIVEEFKKQRAEGKQLHSSAGKLFVIVDKRLTAAAEDFLLGLICWKSGDKDAATALFSRIPVTGKPSFYQRKISEIASPE